MAKEILLVLAAISCLLVGSTAQPSHVVHIVGGAKGWFTPPNATFYDEWASRKKFTVGDKLMFLFHSSVYNIMQVTKEDFDSCDDRHVMNRWIIGPAFINLTQPGMHYYYDSIGLHCEAGQKLKINVTVGDHAIAASGAHVTTPKLIGLFGLFTYLAYLLFM
ncbi:Early nodulin-like protein 1 [Rhynchospora pubera]|uniref:Early nodulin-like protein 1 n=1 Tax=Rhynchospora pubera TaxID=906938 RepID=A0AAV8DZ16_9POAL|nr:Early nodulin-like protein 1 [Rhynchospora pubera]